jgi:hypothetical protein
MDDELMMRLLRNRRERAELTIECLPVPPFSHSSSEEERLVLALCNAEIARRIPQGPVNFYVGQRVRALPGTICHDKGCREGDVYYISSNGLVNVEFDYLGTVAAVYSWEIEEIKNE